ncbi:MAG: iron-sulfur cluster assembly scaffold protein [Thermodesulfobacteriota bacterium]
MNQEQILKLVLDHYENPRNYGEISDADVIEEGGNPGCGDILKIYLNVDSDNNVRDVSFSADGCMLSQAGASILLEKIKGMKVSELNDLSAEYVTELLGKKMVSTRPQCARLGFNTLKKAISKFSQKENIANSNN